MNTSDYRFVAYSKVEIIKYFFFIIILFNFNSCCSNHDKSKLCFYLGGLQFHIGQNERDVEKILKKNGVAFMHESAVIFEDCNWVLTYYLNIIDENYSISMFIKNDKLEIVLVSSTTYPNMEIMNKNKRIFSDSLIFNKSNSALRINFSIDSTDVRYSYSAIIREDKKMFLNILNS